MSHSSGSTSSISFNLNTSQKNLRKLKIKGCINNMKAQIQCNTEKKMQSKGGREEEKLHREI